MSKAIPTLKEFKELVKKKYLDPEWVVPEEEQLKYLNSDEAQEYIKSEYESAVKDFNDGELGEDGFKIGKVLAVANCLYMMFEWV